MQSIKERLEIIALWSTSFAPPNFAPTEYNGNLLAEFELNGKKLKDSELSIEAINKAVTSLTSKLQWLAPFEKPTKTRSREQQLFEAGILANTGRPSQADKDAESARIVAAEQARRDDASKRARYQQFKKELSDANTYLEMSTGGPYGSPRIAWGATNAMRAQMKNLLRAKYPEFADEVK